MESGEFLISVQIDPPGMGKFSEFKETISVLKEADVTLIDINSSRRISHDSIHLGVALSEVGFETIPHVTTRDSSINGLANQILAAHEWAGLRHFLIITGDPYEANQSLIPSQGVFQTNSIGAISALHTTLCSSSDPQLLQLPIRIAAAVNQNENDLVREREQLDAKCGAGADFFMSQPVFSEAGADLLFGFYNSKKTQKPLMIGIWPLIHAHTAKAIRSGRIVGVTLPEYEYGKICWLIDQGEKELIYWGLFRAEELIRYIKRNDMAQGVYIVAPARNPRLILPFLKEIQDMCKK